jgi:hypothetical protein
VDPATEKPLSPWLRYWTVYTGICKDWHWGSGSRITSTFHKMPFAMPTLCSGQGALPSCKLNLGRKWWRVSAELRPFLR